ncbi:MAG: TIGR01906 family membrane protein [Chloroflexi bacterium]|nr:TIGR01906 family membrane protein [Chloroflexota bacterium]
MKRGFEGVLGFVLTLAVPVMLVLGSVRLMMSPGFLAFEYQRPGFPADVYGFTTEDRLRWGPLGIEYLLTDAGIDLLADLRFENGAALFTPRELKHMEDVKVVTQAAFGVLGGVSIAAFAAGAILLARRRLDTVLASMARGGLLVLGLIGAVVVGAVVAWDSFFTLFHRAFFADGTWIFLTSDTLIRLYPEQFWFDCALVVGAITIGGALLLIAANWRFARTRREFIDGGDSKNQSEAVAVEQVK